jgi:hypothetical protein
VLGPLTSDAAKTLAEEPPRHIVISSQETDILTMDTNWRSVTIRLTGEQARRLDRELVDARAWGDGSGYRHRGKIRALAYRASSYLIPVVAIGPGIAIGAIASDGTIRYVVALGVIVALIPFGLRLERAMERRF